MATREDEKQLSHSQSKTLKSHNGLVSRQQTLYACPAVYRQKRSLMLGIFSLAAPINTDIKKDMML